ncbi:MAG: hypothetical protein CMP08_07015 [Xanthomonadales bacterium]|nr:hypothetical protein [Xanthomonadales bacterium]
MVTSGVKPSQYNGGGGYLQGGFVYNQDIHPLRAEIDSSFEESGVGVGEVIEPGEVGNCPAGTSNTNNTVTFFEGTPAFPVCELSQSSVGQPGDQPSEINLTNGFVYYLTDPLRIGNGFTENATADSVDNITLNIEDGVQLFADPSISSAEGGAYLRITRGSTINVNGTRERPVLMTAARLSNGEIQDPTNFTDIGAWGGLVIDGYAPTNAQGLDGGAVPNESISEAAPSQQSNYFGGDDVDDSSGSISYLVVGETGVTIRPDSEVQGITMEAVGAGTSIDHVQVFGSDDDGIEWFGGTVNQRYVMINGAQDDSLDMDLGFSGTIQNALVLQSTARGNRTIEADNNGDGFGLEPVTSPNIANTLLLGAGSAQQGSTGMLGREGFGGDLENTVVTDLQSVTNRDSGTYSNGCFALTDEVDADLQAAGLAFYCVNSSGEPGEADVDPNLYPVWYNGMFQEEDMSGDTSGGFRGEQDESLTVDPVTFAVSTSVQPVDDGTSDDLQAEPYMGAVNPDDARDDVWFRGWIVSVSGE